MNDSHLAFDLVRYRIHKRRWSSISAILAESGMSDTEMKLGLKTLHNIEWDFKDDPWLFFSEDTQQRKEFAGNGVTNPTLCQLLLTSRAFGLTEHDCRARFLSLLRGDE